MTSKKAVVVRVGIDVGAKELIVVLRQNGTALKAQSFANTAADHTRLIRSSPSTLILSCVWRPPGCITWTWRWRCTMPGCP